MKDFWSETGKIKRLLDKRSGLILFLDFDGTLSPIASVPQNAIIYSDVLEILKKLVVIPNSRLIVVSGRSLSDIKSRIRIKSADYCGNHGLEWEIDGRYFTAPVKLETEEIEKVKKIIIALAQKFPETVFEDKGLTFALHYRALDSKRVERLRKVFEIEMEHYINTFLISVIYGKRVFDIKPRVRWDKGDFCSYYLKNALTTVERKRTLSIYLGDDKTDEDAFAKLVDAITIRIGYKSNSRAKYFLRGQHETKSLLQWFLNCLMIG